MNLTDNDIDNTSSGTKDGSHAKTEMFYRIGDLAREFNLTLRTLRFYEDRGLITPKRIGTTRLYGQNDRQRLKLALFGKKVGFSLIEIKQLLDLRDSREAGAECTGVARKMFASQMQVLLQQRIELDEAIEMLSDKINDPENFEFCK